MTATLYLDQPVKDDRSKLTCSEVRVLGSVVWATPADEDHEWVIPIENIVGIEGEAVEQFVDEIPSPGGQYTELVTDIR